MELDNIEITDKERTGSDLIPKIIAIRHAESIANTEGIYQGQTYDTDLSNLGKEQARALAIRLSKLRINKIVASPLKRTYQTALAISKLLDIKVEVNELIKETDHGLWEGKDKVWIQDNYPAVLKLWRERPSSTSFPNGEAFVDTVNRLKVFLDTYPMRESVVVVTHDNMIRILACMGSNRSMDDFWKFKIEPAALNYFEHSVVNGMLKLRTLKLNDNKHLEACKCDLSRHAL